MGLAVNVIHGLSGFLVKIMWEVRMTQGRGRGRTSASGGEVFNCLLFLTLKRERGGERDEEKQQRRHTVRFDGNIYWEGAWKDYSYSNWGGGITQIENQLKNLSLDKSLE